MTSSIDSVLGRCGRVSTGTGHVVAIDDSGRYYKFKRPGRIKARWFRREDVALYEPTPCIPCKGSGKNPAGAVCETCNGVGSHEYRIPLK